MALDTISVHNVSVKISRRFRAGHSCPHHKILKKRRAVCRLAFGFCGPPCFLFLFFFRPQADRQQGPCPTNYTRLGMTVFHARGQRWSIAARCFPTIRWSFMGFKSDLKSRFRMMTFDYVNIDVVNRTNQKPPIWGG